MTELERYKCGKSGRAIYPNTYMVWQKMIARCNCVTDPSYHNYGAIGISVCCRWKDSFIHFIEDMGPKPESLTLERIDNSGNYEKDNCRWATRAEQSRNTRRNRFVTHNGETLCLQDWADRMGIGASSVFARLRRGWTLEKALFTPPMPGKKTAIKGGGYA